MITVVEWLDVLMLLKIVMVINKINPANKYLHAIDKSIPEATSQQVFFAMHLHSKTEVTNNRQITIGSRHVVYEETIMKLFTSK